MPLLDGESTLSEAEMAPRSTSMGGTLSAIDSFVSRTIYLLNFSNFLCFRTEWQDKCILLHVAHTWVLACAELCRTYYSVSWEISCYNCYNMISIYVYMRLRLIEKSTTIDRYLIMSRVPGALKPFGKKLPACGWKCM